MKTWIDAFKGYLKPPVLLFLFLGFSCGVPYNLVGSTLSLWLAQSMTATAAIGLFALVLIPYNFKFLWAPFIDSVEIPYLAKRLGRKKAWGAVFQIGLAVSILGLALTPPAENQWVYRFFTTADGQEIENILPLQTFFWAFLTAFFAASQDIVVDALRVDTLTKDEMGEGASLYQYGYRMGMLLSGAGVLALSSRVSWSAAYAVTAFFVFVGLLALLRVKNVSEKGEKADIRQLFFPAFKDFVSRHKNWIVVLSFVVLYKLCNAMLGKMAYVFYAKMDFTTDQIALVSGTIGPFVTMIGVAIGGILVARFSVLKCLFYLGWVECLTSLTFALLSIVGNNVPFFVLTIVFDNIVGGMGGSVFVAYLSGLCSRKCSATQYALLSGLMAISTSFVASVSGFLAEKMGWYEFFIMTGFLMVPALCLLIGLMNHERKVS